MLQADATNFQPIIDNFLNCDDLLTYFRYIHSFNSTDTNSTTSNETSLSMSNDTDISYTTELIYNESRVYTTNKIFHHTLPQNFSTLLSDRNVTNGTNTLENDTIESYQCYNYDGLACIYVYNMDHNIETAMVNFTNIVTKCIPASSYESLPSDTVFVVLYFVFIIVGIIGNTSMIATLIKSSAKVSSTVIYFIALAIFDSISLLNHALPMAILLSTSIDITTLSNVNCKLYRLLQPASFEISNFILGTITLERAISVAVPLHVKHIFNPTSAKLMISFQCILLMLLNCVPVFESSVLKLHGGVSICGATLRAMSYLGRMYGEHFNLLLLLLQFVIPFSFVAIGNFAIIVVLIARHCKRKVVQSTKTNLDKKLAFSLLRISVFFLITTLPDLVSNFHKRSVFEERKLIYHITLSLHYLNCVMNFYFYFLSGARFRAMYMALFCQCCRPKKTQRNKIEHIA